MTRVSKRFIYLFLFYTYTCICALLRLQSMQAEVTHTINSSQAPTDFICFIVAIIVFVVVILIALIWNPTAKYYNLFTGYFFFPYPSLNSLLLNDPQSSVKFTFELLKSTKFIKQTTTLLKPHKSNRTQSTST